MSMITLLLSILIDPSLNKLDDADPLVRVESQKIVQKDRWLWAKIPFNQGSPEKNARMANIVIDQMLVRGEKIKDYMWGLGKRDPDFWKRLEQFSDERMGHREFNMIHGD